MSQVKKTEYLENFSVRLRAALSRRGVTLQQVAAACGVATSTVGAWTQAKNWPAVEVQRQLADFLETSVSFLIHGITEYPQMPLAARMVAEATKAPAQSIDPYLLEIARSDPKQVEAWLAGVKSALAGLDPATAQKSLSKIEQGVRDLAARLSQTASTPPEVSAPAPAVEAPALPSSARPRQRKKSKPQLPLVLPVILPSQNQPPLPSLSRESRSAG